MTTACYIASYRNEKYPRKKDGKAYDAVKTLFPGYVFIKTTMNFSTYYQFKENPHIIRTLNYLGRKDKSFRTENSPILHMDPGKPDESSFFKEIPKEEMMIVLKLIDDKEIIEYSQISLKESKVVVESGPLKGMESFIKKIDKHKKRAKVLMKMMGAEQMIDLGIEIIKQ
ncbi:antiterminator LoaP [Paenibacillus sp. P26]|nr:antiterminator LoaP [Paenibacillus sp. P26]